MVGYLRVQKTRGFLFDQLWCMVEVVFAGDQMEVVLAGDQMEVVLAGDQMELFLNPVRVM